MSLLSGILIYNNLKANEDEIKYNKLKKPYIENGPFFNVSHSKEYVVFVKSENEIGIDIECVNEKNMSILDYAFNEDEKDYILSDKIVDLSSIERLTKLWTIKESLFKASGSEKYIEPRNINTICEAANLPFLDKNYNIYSINFLNYIISVASIERYDDIRIIEDSIL